MAEAKGKGHAGPQGRRNLQMTNTAEEGELCIYTGHSIGRFSTVHAMTATRLVLLWLAQRGSHLTEHRHF